MNGLFLGGFDNKDDVANQFSIELKENEVVLFAEYNIGDYCGDAWVIFTREDKIFEVHGSHCSCYGLEGQWDEEESSTEAILTRLKNGGQSQYAIDEVKKLLDGWSNYSHLDFTFDTLPQASELVKLFNFNELLKNENLIVEQDKKIKEIQNNIVEEIKKGLLEKQDNLTLNYDLQLSHYFEPFIKIKNDELREEFSNLFNSTFQKLNDKGWKSTFTVSPDFNLSANIHIPHIQPTVEKKNTVGKINKTKSSFKSQL